MYRYDPHVHSKEASLCAHSSAKEMVRAYHNVGFSGMVLTNHFIHGNTSVPRELDWETRMHMYYDAYLAGKEEGDRLDFDVLFGIEHKYTNGKEILIYGIDLDFLLNHPELETADIDTYAKLVHEAGGILVHAHPMRIREYIDPNIMPRLDICDGIEIYNAHDDMEINEMARKEAVRLDKFFVSGGDNHKDTDQRIGMAGMVFDKRMKTIEEFVQALKKKEGKTIINGVIK